jgi:hypothetical protein
VQQENERGSLENLAVQRSDAIDGMAANNAQVGHVHLTG